MSCDKRILETEDGMDEEVTVASANGARVLDKEELLQQAGSILEAFHIESIAYYWDMGDYKERWWLDAILEELERRIGRNIVAEQHPARFLPVAEVIDDVVADSNDDDENTAWDARVDPDEVELDGRGIDWVAVATADGGGVSNVVDFASGLPSPQKFEACQRFIMRLNEDDLMRQVENVLEALRAEDNCDYNLRCRLVDILGELERCIGRSHIKRRFMAMLAQHQREIDLYDANDYEGLLREGLIDSHEYELLRPGNNEVNWQKEGF